MDGDLLNFCKFSYDFLQLESLFKGQSLKDYSRMVPERELQIVLIPHDTVVEKR